MYKRILLAVDGSDISFRAAQEAAKISRLTNSAEVTIAYVSDYKEEQDEVAHDSSKLKADMARRQKIRLIVELYERDNIIHHVRKVRGIPGPAIVKMTQEQHFDLLVIGSRGQSPIQEVMLGSVSHKVVHQAACPVLIVK